MLNNIKKKESQEKKEDGVGSSPHSDYRDNKITFDRFMEMQEFALEIKIELQYVFPNTATCCLFIHGQPPTNTQAAKRNGAYHITFHQKRGDFQLELEGIFKTLKSKGLLRHKPT